MPWACAACTLLNEAHAAQCAMCAGPRPAAAAAAAAAVVPVEPLAPAPASAPAPAAGGADIAPRLCGRQESEFSAGRTHVFEEEEEQKQCESDALLMRAMQRHADTGELFADAEAEQQSEGDRSMLHTIIFDEMARVRVEINARAFRQLRGRRRVDGVVKFGFHTGRDL